MKYLLGMILSPSLLIKQQASGKVFNYSRLKNNLLHASTRHDIKADGEWIMQKGKLEEQYTYFTSFIPHSNAIALVFRWQLKNMIIEQRYSIAPSSASVSIAASLLYQNDIPARLEAFKFTLPEIFIDDKSACSVSVPGPFFPTTYTRPVTPYDSLVNKKVHFHSAPDAGFGLLLISNELKHVNIASWMKTCGETNYVPFIKGNGRSIDSGFENFRYHLLNKGTQVNSDEMIISFSSSSEASLAQYRKDVEATMPLDTKAAEWVKAMVILEVFPEYYKGGFSEITSKLQTYKDVGFNMIYLMPHWRGGYSPIDLYEVETKYGTKSDLKSLVHTAHALGMKVLFDMVIHGFNQQAPIIQQKPLLFIKEPTGKPALHPTWKSVSTDWASEAYQQYMVELVLHDLQEYDIDGYRIDAASYKGPNWDPNISYPAYKSGASAPVLMTKMLKAMRAKKPDAIFLNEVFGPVFYTVSNLSHDNQTEAVEMLSEKMRKGFYHADDYKQYLTQVYSMLPSGANRVFFSRNHDTSWFYHFNGYTPLYFCFEAIHAFFGIPEVFAGDAGYKHNPQPGVYELYRKLFDMRLAHKELTSGLVKLREVHSNNKNVFAGARQLGKQYSIVLVNMDNEESNVRVSVDSEINLGLNLTATDVYKGKAMSVNAISNSFQVSMQPYQVLVVVPEL
jgi:hypothetical protein